ncbi:tetratricopeptide repeat protein [Halopseudomonas salina]|uniref:Pellicle/biofilm biosynthesis protein PelB n=1 Tax=Halopseudomonas salina TaxID=1323744 RepID=A0ABQ1PXQ8_9GAMM|nr:tetratricopeptide repeat protein [Halopseudomonas salina]GGD05879.1 pellicle/biofilm biosynthesis protein PelB [Halopseudomonas salina]
MRNSSASKSVRLVSPWTLAFSAAAIGGVLVLTYNSEDVFLPDEQERADDVSASYAEVLLASRPEDDELRLDLVQLLVDLGQYSRARRHLLGWENPDVGQMEYYRLKIDALSALHGQDPSRLEPARAQLMAYDHRQLSVEQARHWADLALRMEMPWLAADVYHSLALRVPEEHLPYLKRAARWYLASNQSGKAAMVYLDILAASEEVEDRRYYLRRAYDALLAVGAGDQASRLLVRERAELTDTEADAAWLKQGVQMAVGSQRMDLAAILVARWRELQPYSAEPVDAQFRLELAQGNLREAWETGDLLLALRPEDPDLLRQMAQLGEWLGNSRAALDYWTQYLNLREDPQAREHAWRLAFQLYDYQQGIALLEPTAGDRRLSEEKLDALVFGYESLGQPARTEAWLRQYLRSYPSHRMAWVRLLQNLEHTQQFEAQTAVWDDMASRFELSTTERIEWASAYWRIYQPERAWDILDIDNRNIDDPEYWRTLAGLAWELERDDELRNAYERMLEKGIALNSGEESDLIELYRLEQPRKALEMLLAGWRERGDPGYLVMALDMAIVLGDIDLLRTLLAEADEQPSVALRPQVMLARGWLAERDGDLDTATRIYRSALARYPGSPLVRERLMWFFIDHRRTADLPLMTHRWRAFARRNGNMWLPFAAANQMLGRHEEALAWYRMHLRANPYDWLARAAYVDGLEAAERFDLAQRLRHQLVEEFETRPGDAPRMAFESPEVAPQRYAVWLRLLAASHSGLRSEKQAMQWQDGSPAMLQLWFDRMLTQLDIINQPSQKDAWQAWGRSHGLDINAYHSMQEALRNYNRDMLTKLVATGELDPAQNVEALDRLGEESTALGLALSHLGGGNPTIVDQQLRRQAVDIQSRIPQGARIGWRREDLGGVELSGTHATIAGNVADDWYTSVDLERLNYKADDLDSSVLGTEKNARVTLSRKLEDGRIALTVDSSSRADEDRVGVGASRTWQLGGRDQLEVGLGWNQESLDSGFMRAVGTQDSIYVAGIHGFSARDQLSWSIEQRAYGTRYGHSLGNGTAFNIEFNQIQRFEGPTWVARAGIDYQRNNLSRRQLDDLTVADGGPVEFDVIEASGLLQEEYGRLYAGTSWRRGFPGALNRGQPEYTWLVDVQAGWDWVDSQFTYGLSTGVGSRVLGDDELALTFGYQSEPRGTDAEAGGILELTYSKRFGR